MNIIIVGCGKVGIKLIERLSNENEHNIVGIDLDNEKIDYLSAEYDIMGVVGSGVSIETLTEAGVESADLLIAVTGSDEINLLSCLTAKKLGNCRTIPRIRKPEYSKTFMMFKEELSLAMVINPEHAAASEIARILRFPSVIEIDTFAKGRVEILKFYLDEKNLLNKMKVKEVVAKLKSDILICGVERGNEAFIPDGEFTLKKGDYVSIVASISESAQFFKKIGLKTDKAKDAIIVGGCDTAYYLAKQLIMEGISVTIIEKDIDRCGELCRVLPKARVIHGDGTDRGILKEEGISKASAFISMTNIDEENIMLSLYAKSVMNGKIVTKINRIAYDDVISGLDLGTIVYPKDITAEYIVKFVRAKKNSLGSNIETMHLILNDKAEALEFRIGENSVISNRRIDSLKLKKNILIACVTRGHKIFVPRGHDVIMPGDTVIVVTLKSGFMDITDILDRG